MLEPTIDKLGKEEDFEDFQEDQGQATQGKPSILFAYLYPSFTYASFSIMFYAKCIVFNCYYPPFISICWRLGSTSHLLSSFLDDTLSTPAYPIVLVA
jgi:hypothetical protein